MSEIIEAMAPYAGQDLDYNADKDRIENWDEVESYREFSCVGDDSNVLNFFEPIEVDRHPYEERLKEMEVGETFAPTK